ncbi:hypothetical protein BJX66DRAFT_339948 [Aspergillus keveii]|uniref:Thioredoxin domain-containing protein n=1 Tax=Aspergillus keveii TaxID=714993 RepID=A0ABR4FZU4_9EURO
MGNGLGPIASTADYEERVTNSNGPTVVEFYESCAHTKALTPWVNHLCGKYFEIVEFYEVDMRDESMRDLVTRHGILDTPTFLIYDGKGVRRVKVNIGSNFSRLETAVDAMARLEHGPGSGIGLFE